MMKWKRIIDIEHIEDHTIVSLPWTSSFSFSKVNWNKWSTINHRAFCSHTQQYTRSRTACSAIHRLEPMQRLRWSTHATNAIGAIDDYRNLRLCACMNVCVCASARATHERLRRKRCICINTSDALICDHARMTAQCVCIMAATVTEPLAQHFCEKFA